MKIKNKNKYFGFTFVEVMVIIAIMGILASAGLVSLKNARINARLKAGQEELSSTIKSVQSYALQGYQPSNLGANEKVCGFGFRFSDDGTYKVYYNKLDPSTDGCGTQNGDADFLHYDVGNSTEVPNESYSLPDGVVLSFPGDPLNADIFFTVPHGNIYNYEGKSLTDIGGQIFGIAFGADPSKNKAVFINGIGAIWE